MSLSLPQRLREGCQRGGRKDVRATRKARRGVKCWLTFRRDVAVELTAALISTQEPHKIGLVISCHGVTCVGPLLLKGWWEPFPGEIQYTRPLPPRKRACDRPKWWLHQSPTWWTNAFLLVLLTGIWGGITSRSRNDSEAVASPKAHSSNRWWMIPRCLRQLGSSGGVPLLGSLFSTTVYFFYKAKALQKFFQRRCSPVMWYFISWAFWASPSLLERLFQFWGNIPPWGRRRHFLQ